MQIKYLPDLEKLIEYLASAIVEVSSSPCTTPSARTKISFTLLSIWTDELMSTPEITTFLPQSKLDVKK